MPLGTLIPQAISGYVWEELDSHSTAVLEFLLSTTMNECMGSGLFLCPDICVWH